MSCYPSSATNLNYITYPVGPSAGATGVAASGSTNTKGSYVQFVASTTFASQSMIVDMPSNNTGGAMDSLVDVATGAAASEVVVIANLPYGSFYTTGVAGATGYIAPLSVASSTRVSARSQSDVASAAVAVSLTFIGTNGILGISSFSTGGALTASSRMTLVDAGGTANVKGSYVQMVASTAALTQWMLPLTCRVGQGQNAAGVVFAVDVATGGSGSEVVLLPDLRVTAGPTGGSGSITQQGLPCFPVMTYIASSTRIAFRASCISNTATLRTFDAGIVYGTGPSEPSGGSGGAWAFA